MDNPFKLIKAKIDKKKDKTPEKTAMKGPDNKVDGVRRALDAKKKDFENRIRVSPEKIKKVDEVRRKRVDKPSGASSSDETKGWRERSRGGYSRF